MRHPFWEESPFAGFIKLKGSGKSWEKKSSALSLMRYAFLKGFAVCRSFVQPYVHISLFT